MRVLVVSLNRGRGSGGVTRQQAMALAAAGHEVTLLHAGTPLPMANIDLREVELSRGVLPVHEYLPRGSESQMPAAEMSAGLAWSIVNDFQVALDDLTERPDVILAHHANLSTIACASAAGRWDIPYVVFAHGTGVEPRLGGGYRDTIWRAIAEALRESAGIIVTTRYVRDELVRRVVDIPAHRFITLPCGVDTREFQPTESTAMRDRFDLPEQFAICAGALIPAKGPQNVVEASKHYADLAPTVFIGEGSARRELERALDRRGTFLGFVSDAEKAALFNEASVLVAAPDKREHFGIIYAEGLASGAVPVAYRGGGVDSIVTAETGILTDRTPESLGSAVRFLLERPDTRKLLARRGRRRAETHFDADSLSRHFVEWLTGIVRAHRPPLVGAPVSWPGWTSEEAV
ncbi:MAG: glycosyltransferase family 4 protein [Acidimicrobiia bacterium]|nr:glycosyltransferase family 4 protein [Acidimicrobiia bacterium]